MLEQTWDRAGVVQGLGEAELGGCVPTVCCSCSARQLGDEQWLQYNYTQHVRAVNQGAQAGAWGSSLVLRGASQLEIRDCRLPPFH